MTTYLKRIQSALNLHGLLLMTDPVLPSVTSIIAGKPFAGSWWGHPKGGLMYNISNELLDSPDILGVKLINKKMTFVKRGHWNALASIGEANLPWQLKSLTPEHKGLLKLTHKENEIRANDSRMKMPPTEVGKLITRLEERLLVHSTNEHTASGKHVRLIKTWVHALDEKNHRVKFMTPTKAMKVLDSVATEISANCDGVVKFPWH